MVSIRKTMNVKDEVDSCGIMQFKKQNNKQSQNKTITQWGELQSTLEQDIPISNAFEAMLYFE